MGCPTPAVAFIGILLLSWVPVAAQETEGGETHRRALEALSRQDLVEAERISVDWLREHPEDADVLLVLGLTRFEAARFVESQGRPRSEIRAAYQEALRVFLAVERLSLGTPRPGLDYAAGYVYLVSGRPEEAIERFSRALDQAPARQELYRLRGSCHLELGRAGLAEADFRRAVELDPGDLASRLYHAQSLFLLGRGWDARAGLDEAYRRIAAEPPDERHWRILFDKARYSPHDLEAARASTT